MATETEKLAAYATAMVETNDGVYLHDLSGVFAIGIGQWHGVRALDMLREIWDTIGWDQTEGLPSHIVNAAKADDNSAYWNTYYLSGAETASIDRLMGRDDALNVQGNRLALDMGEYINAHYDGADRDTKGAAMFAVEYHQGPKYAVQAKANCGNPTDLEAMTNACYANGVLGQYPNRIKTAHDIIAAGTYPPKYGSGGGSSGAGGDNGGSNSQPKKKDTVLDSAWTRGDRLIVKPLSSDEEELYPAGDRWYPVGRKRPSKAGDASGGTTGGGGNAGGSEAQQGVWNWMESRIDKFAYAQAEGRLDPDHSGIGDCSSLCYRAYMDVTGINVGTWTGEQYHTGTEVVSGGGRMSDEQLKLTQKGDLCVMTWNSGYGHVEMLEGWPSPRHIGHGGPDNGPDIGDDIRTYLDDTADWTVRRYV